MTLSDFSTAEPLMNTAIVLLLPWTVVYILWTLLKASRVSPLETGKISSKDTQHDVYKNIQPLADLDWRTTDPIKIRPFKKHYHLTMGLENLTFSDLLAVDKTYLDRIKLRRELMSQHSAMMLACNDVAKPAVDELYQWLFTTYLPRRFPTMFEQLSTTRTEKHIPAQTKNLVTDEHIPTHAVSAIEALRNIGSHIDTDFLVLLPSSTSQNGQSIYHLEAFVSCFPSGFSTLAKLSQPLADIHKPVPGYRAKLERSMDRYFAKVPVATIVRRSNWTVTTSDDLFIQAGTHLYADKSSGTADVSPELQRVLDKEKKDVVIEKCRLRTERQTLHRLPNSKALVFAFKTYQYKLKDVKADGDGPALAEAIEGLATGSVPDMHFYKRGIVWGDKVAEYLRSEDS